MREHRLAAEDLILPVFLLDGTRQVQDVASMPGVQRLSLDGLFGVAEECVALGVPVIVHPDARAILAEHYGDKLTDARLRMARTPQGASLIANPRTKAPGIRVENVFIMAGVPAITQGMLAALDGQLPGGAPVLSRTIAAWTQESTVAATLGAVEKAHPGAQIGSYPFWREGRTGANFVIRATDAALLATVAAMLMASLRDIGIDPVDGEL